jgi:hypothetical protein
MAPTSDAGSTRTVYAHTWSEVLDDQIKTYRPNVADALQRRRRKPAAGPATLAKE